MNKIYVEICIKRQHWLHYCFSYYYGGHAKYASSWVLAAGAVYCLWNDIHGASDVQCYALSAITFVGMAVPYQCGPFMGLLLAVSSPAFMPCPICPPAFSSEECVEFQRVNGCHACDRTGCWQTNPTCLFNGQPRASHEDAQLGDTVPHMRETSIACTADGLEMQGRLGMNWWQEYEYVCFCVNESNFFSMGEASGEECNCLIDTLRQQLNLECDIKAVRDYVQTLHSDLLAGN